MINFSDKPDTATAISMGAYGDAARTRLGRHFMATASISVMSVMLSATANAQVPPECVPGMPVDGDTVVCVADAPTVIGPVAIDGVDDLTVVVGDAATPTTVDGGVSNGISLTGAGSHSVVVTAGSSVSGLRGVNITSAVDDISVQGSGAITATGDYGIYASTGGGNINLGGVDPLGDLTGARRAIRASTSGNGSVVIDTSAGTSSSAGTSPIGVFISGTGSVDVTTADVNQTNGATGVFVNSSSSGDVSIDSTAGSLYGDFQGALAVQTGTGNVNITTADATGRTGRGVVGYIGNIASGGAITIHTGAGTVTGSGYGALAGITLGSGDISITAGNVTGGYVGISSVATTGDTQIALTSTANVTGATALGIASSSTGGNISIQGEGATVVGGTGGILATSGGGSIVVDGIASVSGDNGSGLSLFSNGGSITVSAVDTVLGTGGRGIDVDAQGGNVNLGGITALGDVTGSTQGIFAATNGAGNIIIDTSNGAVTGQDRGILVQNYGTGSTTITAADTTGAIEHGITVSGGAMSGDITVTSTGTASGGNYGIRVDNFGAGMTTMTAADSTGTNFSGLRAFGAATTGAMTVTATGTTTGGINGLDVRHYGTGALDVSAADVTGAGFVGIYARAGTSSTELSVSSTGTVSGLVEGIRAINEGVGRSTVTTADVTSMTGFGISADSRANSGDLSITANGTVTGGTDGIHVENNGVGTTTVVAGTVTGADDGIEINHGATAAGISVTATGDVTGGNVGIRAVNNGSGAVTVTATSVTGMANEGIFAQNNGTGDTSITVENSTGGQDGIDVSNVAGSGTMTIVATGDVVSVGSGHGILAQNQSNGDLNITANNTTGVGGLNSGIFARQNGTDADADLTVTSTGTATGAGYGITAFGNFFTPGNGGDVTVTAVDTVGQNLDGIHVRNYGDAITINSTGTATGANNGILARSNGTGTTSITAVDSTGTNRSGISVTNLALSGDVNVTSTGTATGGAGGINLTNSGTGATTLVANTVTGGSRGISVVNSGAATDISITATGDVTGGFIGVSSYNYGNGANTVNVSNVTGTGGEGLFAYNGANGTDISVTSTGAVSGGNFGVRVGNTGTGATNVSVGAVSGTSNDGVFVYNGAASGDISVTATGSVSGALDGIDVTNNGSGNLSVAAVDVTGTMDGIRAINVSTTATALDLTGDVTGGNVGVLTLTQSGVDLILRTNGSITGASGVAISTQAFGGSATSSDGVHIEGTVNGSIMTLEGDDHVSVFSTGVINGTTMLGDGNDRFSDSDGAYGDVRGGSGVDSFNFNIGGRVVNNSGGAGDRISEFEIYNLNVGTTTLAGVNQGITDVNVGTNGGLNLASGASVSGNVNNAGALNVAQGGVGTGSIGGNLTQNTGSSITFNRTSGAVGDVLNVGGDVNLAGDLNIVETGLFFQPITLINGGGALSGNFDSVNGLSTGGLLFNQAVDLDMANANVNIVTNVTNAAEVAGLRPNQVAIANAMTQQLFTGALGDGSTGGLDTTTVRLGRLGDVNTLSKSLTELNVEIVESGIQVFQNSQIMFMNSLLDQAGAPANGGGVVKTASLGQNAMGGAHASNGKGLWTRVQASHFEQDGDVNNIDYETDGVELAVGITGIDVGAAQVGFAASIVDYDTDSKLGGADGVDTQIYRFAAHGGVDLNSGQGINARLDGAVGFATGSNSIDQNIEATEIGRSLRQSGKAEIEGFNGIARVQLSGSNGDTWAIRPHVLAAFDSTRQEALSIGTGATALNVEQEKNTRYTLGYGATLEHGFDRGAFVRLNATGMHHFGDTQIGLASQFSAPGASASSFDVIGKDVKSQYMLEGTYGHKISGGWQVGVGAFGQVGDIEGYGGRFSLAKKF